MNRVRLLYCSALVLVAIVPARGQDHGAARLHALVNGLTVTPRVLVIGARPDDADAGVIAWLARGRHVQTGYLSLTRGESAPNYTGLETGATLGAIHVQEALAARRIDGGEQYFTRAFDFGSARNTAHVFEEWDRTELLGDVVAVVRAFRPHVILSSFRSDTSDGDGHHQASATIARDVFDASLDTLRFSASDYGMPWSPISLFEPGPGLTIDSREYDRMLGRTYADLAVESRSQLRSFGFLTSPFAALPSTQWRRTATRIPDTATGGSISSLFAGIDTSFGRLHRDTPREQSRNASGQVVERALVTQLPAILAHADSARRGLDLQDPTAVVPHLRRVAELAAAARRSIVGCKHPSRDAVMSIQRYRMCRPEWLDLDASLDLIQQRANDALLSAVGISFESVSDREFLASGDTALVTVTVFNHSDSTVLLNDVSVSGAASDRMTEPILVPARGTARVQRPVTSIAYAHPWWVWQRKKNFYPPSITSLDGVPRPGRVVTREFGASAVAIPENVRRLSDVDVTLTIGFTTITTSIGDVVFRTADPVLGVRDRAMSGVPAVTLTFERALEWAQAGTPLKKHPRVILRSFSDKPQRFVMTPASRGGVVRIDSLPPPITLAPREAREVSMSLRGTPGVERYDLGIIGIAPRDTFEVGFRTAQYSYLAPQHFFRTSMVSVLAVDVAIPSRLSVAYIRGAGDDADVALRQLGIPAYALNNEGLMRMELDALSTIVIGPDAFRVDRGLVTQMSRLTEFARKGGTVVVLGNAEAVAQPGVLPFPVGYARPFAEQVTRDDATVTAVDPRSRLLTWPNVIRGQDWSGWVGARALSVPSTADSRYSVVVETHDPEQTENRNSILVATVGKGRIIHTSLTLTQQISNAVPGAMRLFVNLLSAGLPVESRAATANAREP